MISSLAVKLIEDLDFYSVGLSLGHKEDDNYDIMVQKQGGRLLQNEVIGEGLYLISVKSRDYTECEYEVNLLANKLSRITNKKVSLQDGDIYEDAVVTVKVNQIPQFAGMKDGKFVWFFYITIKEIRKW